MSENEQPVALVVEDETLLRLHAAGLLEEHGFAVVEAANAAEALTVLKSRGDVRLLFTDIQMPGDLDGMTATKWQRRWQSQPMRRSCSTRYGRQKRPRTAFKLAGSKAEPGSASGGFFRTPRQ
jgi:CheY-like chemotaxis protein